MELPADYWQDIRRNCASILGGLPEEKTWLAWPILRTTYVAAEWVDGQGAPEVLKRFTDQFSALGSRALVTVVSHELTLIDDPYPITLCFDPDNQTLQSAFPAHAYPLYFGFKGVQRQHFDRLYESIARGAQARH